MYIRPITKYCDCVNAGVGAKLEEMMEQSGYYQWEEETPAKCPTHWEIIQVIIAYNPPHGYYG